MRLSRVGIVHALLLLGFVLITACSDDDVTGSQTSDFFVEDPFSEEVPLQAQTQFRLEGINGSIEITGVPGATSISLTGVRRVESDSEEDAAAHLPLLEVETTSSETAVTVRTVQPEEPDGRTYIVNYTVTVPQEIEVDVTNINGDITVESAHRDVWLLCVNGTIHTDGIEGNLVATVTNGVIDASVAPAPGGRIEMGVTNGNIELEIPQDTSAEFSAGVVNGTITLQNLSLSNEIRTPRSRTGTLGAGDGTIGLGVVNGSILVRGS